MISAKKGALTKACIYMQGVYSVKWGTDAKTLFVGAADHNLRVYGTAT